MPPVAGRSGKARTRLHVTCRAKSPATGRTSRGALRLLAHRSRQLAARITRPHLVQRVRAVAELVNPLPRPLFDLVAPGSPARRAAGPDPACPAPATTGAGRARASSGRLLSMSVQYALERGRVVPRRFQPSQRVDHPGRVTGRAASSPPARGGTGLAPGRGSPVPGVCGPEVFCESRARS